MVEPKEVQVAIKLDVEPFLETMKIIIEALQDLEGQFRELRFNQNVQDELVNFKQED